MTDSNAPKNGDFASIVEREAQKSLAKESNAVVPDTPTIHPNALDTTGPVEPQTLEDVLFNGEDPSDDLLDELRTLDNAPPLSDEELERQALEDGGADDDPRTPE